MGRMIELAASDGHRPQAYLAEPAGDAKGTIVLIQEVFGVTPHLTSIADDYAGEGFRVIAPALFDRVATGTHFAPTEEERQKAAAFYKQLKWDETILDVGAAFAAASTAGKTGILGFCLGGDIAWAGACEYRFDAAVCYYGGRIADMLDQTNNCPVMMHHGSDDPWLPPENLQKIAASGKPELTIHNYEGVGHAFNNDTLAHRYVAGAAALARGRSVEFFESLLAA